MSNKLEFTRRGFLKHTALASGVFTVEGVVGASLNPAHADDLTYDYVIAGAGSAGCVLANRLSENGSKVLLIEAGPPDAHPAIAVPLRVRELFGSEYDWGYRTTKQSNASDREIFWPRGKTLGGSSALNAMIYVRGTAADYDRWAYDGNPGWSYEDVLPYFKKSEDFSRGADDYHGAGGPLRVTADYEPHPLTARMVDAAVEYGLPRNDDTNGADPEGAAFCQFTIRDGSRDSTAAAFLRPALERSNLTVLTEARVKKVEIENYRVTGVTYIQADQEHTVAVSKEAVLSGGTLESPRMLMLSGIGPRETLEQHGIPVIRDIPGVGQNLHDHTLVPVIFEGSEPIEPPSDPARPVMHAQLFIRSNPDLPAPDMQPLLFHVPNYVEGMEPVTRNAYTLHAGGVNPSSRGYLTITGPGVDDPLHVDPNILETDADVQTLVDNIRINREIAAQPALAEVTKREIYPGPEVQSDEELADYVRRTVGTYHHQVGTCKMGIDRMAVVDRQLKVHGVEGLRVVDCSIMPSVPTGNTNAPAIMVAEKAADMIRADS